MKISEVIQKIEQEKQELSKDMKESEGMIRLQEQMAAYEGADRLVWSYDLAEELSQRKPLKSFYTGVPKFDEVTGGFKERQLVTIGGDSGHGKTQVGLYLLEKLEEMNPVMIPIEQSNEEIIQQRTENGYSVPRFLSPRELSASVTLDWIEERVIEGIAKHNTKCVLIDHLGYIENDQNGNENLAYRIEKQMQRLKNMAKRYKIVIILLVHISQTDEGNPPSTKDIKNSSSIKQESDKVIMVWRKNEIKEKMRVYSNETLLSVLKNRQTGKLGNIGMIFNTETGEYKEENEWIDSLLKSEDDDF